MQVKLVNIRNDDIADGNPKLTLGLIWTIILHFQVEWPPLGSPGLAWALGLPVAPGPGPPPPPILLLLRPPALAGQGLQSLPAEECAFCSSWGGFWRSRCPADSSGCTGSRTSQSGAGSALLARRLSHTATQADRQTDRPAGWALAQGGTQGSTRGCCSPGMPAPAPAPSGSPRGTARSYPLCIQVLWASCTTSGVQGVLPAPSPTVGVQGTRPVCSGR